MAYSVKAMALGGVVALVLLGISSVAGFFKGCSTKEKAAETPASVEAPAEPGKN
jgi:hypothetical protein